jgi:tetratricopeptide (TPR) repeat protein
MVRAEPYQAVVQLYDAGCYAEAAAAASEALREFPDDGHLWQLYGTARCSLNDYPAAREALELASVLVPLHPLARIALARSYARLGQEELALTIYEYLVEAGSCPTGLLPTVAVDLNGLGEYRLALKACETLTDRDPAHHQAHFGTAYYLGRLGAPPEALIPPLAMAMDLAPHVLHYRLNLAFVLAEAGRPDEAHALLTAVDLERVLPCGCWLRRIRRICEQVGDSARAWVCDRLVQSLPG